MPKPVNKSGRYIPGLDGLRALAVMAVIAYHLGWNGTPGGLLGVGIFFTLSGYLITDLMIGERRRTGGIDMKSFWLRRARRLLPAMLLMLAAVSVWLFFTDRSRLFALQGEIGASLLYFSNWRLIFHHVSYFESFGPPSPIGHLWSLAVEEQFYLLWPLIVLLLLKLLPRRGMLAGCAVMLAAGSAIAMAMLYEPGTDPSRVYYGTDTRAFGMLIGAALALIWPSWKLADRTKVSRRTGLLLDGTGIIGLAGITAMIVWVGEYDPFLYQGGMVLLSLATAAVVAVIVHPASMVGAMLGWKPLRWLGVRSYGIYLWHYPVIILSTPLVDTGGWDPVRTLLQIAATLLLSALSWQFIEEPIRRGALGRIWQKAKSGSKWVRRPAFAAATGLGLMMLVSFVGLEKLLPEDAKAASSTASDEASFVKGHTASFTQEDDWSQIGINKDDGDLPAEPSAKPTEQPALPEPPASPDNGTAAEQQKNDSPAQPSETPVQTAGGTGEGNEQQSAPPAELDASPDTGEDASAAGTETQPPASPEQPAQEGSDPAESSPNPSEPAEPQGTAVMSGKNMNALGDSIMLDIQPNLEELLPGISVDGKIGRQFREAQSIVDGLSAQGKLGEYVLIALGSNGAFSQKQLDTLLDTLKDAKQVLLVNTRVPRDWQDTVNEMLDGAEADYDNVHVIDWYGASKGKDEYFAKDGVHLTKTGAAAYASLIIDALNE